FQDRSRQPARRQPRTRQRDDAWNFEHGRKLRHRAPERGHRDRAADVPRHHGGGHRGAGRHGGGAGEGCGQELHRATLRVRAVGRGEIMRVAAVVAGICCLTLLTACNGSGVPLVFGKVDTFGASASATAPDQGGNVTLGYRSAKVAVVPVTAQDAYGNVVVLKERRASVNDGAFSTFASFEASAGGAVSGVKACLGDTFATGLAAQVVAQKLERVCRP